MLGYRADKCDSRKSSRFETGGGFRIKRKRFAAASGATTDYLYNVKREFKASLNFINPADAAIWENAFRERPIENSESFAAKWDQIWPDPILWKNVPHEFSPPYRIPNYPDQLTHWEEFIA